MRRGGKGLWGHKAWHLGFHHPKGDSEEASVIKAGLKVEEASLPTSPNP